MEKGLGQDHKAGTKLLLIPQVPAHTGTTSPLPNSVFLAPFQLILLPKRLNISVNLIAMHVL